MFFVKDVFGLKVVQENKIESVRAQLLNSISGSTIQGPLFRTNRETVKIIVPCNQAAFLNNEWQRW